MRCIAIETTLGREHLASADRILPSIRNLLDIPELCGTSDLNATP